MKTAVILSGGLGTRLRPLTLEMPKALIPVQGKSLTEQVIDKVKESGVKTVYLSIGYMSDKIEEYFDKLDLGVKINYIVESNRLELVDGCIRFLYNKLKMISQRIS